MPEVSVTPVVRAIKIMIGRKVFFGTSLNIIRNTSLTATNRIKKVPMKWDDLFRNTNCEGN